MAARPLWKGQIRLSLVAIPVEMYSATRTGGRIAFRQIHEPSGQPIRYEKVVPGIGPVDRDEILKGYEVEKGSFVLLTEDEIEDVRLETKKTFELVQFVDACEIEPIYFDKPHFIVPQDELAEDAYRVLRDALRQSRKVGLGQLALRGREYLAVLKPCGTGLLLETLHYEDEIRKADPFFASISKAPAEAELLEVAKELIERKTAPFDAGVFKDHYSDALRALIARKSKGKKGKVIATGEERAAPGGGEVIDLMAALKASLETSGSSKGKARKPPAKAKPAAASRRRKSA
jgi:DNA end-binding protein Ku